MTKTTMAFLAACAFIVAAVIALEARTTIVLPIAFGLTGLALAVRAMITWRANNPRI